MKNYIRSWWSVLIIFLLADFILHQYQEPATTFRAIPLIAGLVNTFLMFYIFNSIICLLPKYLNKLALIVFSFIITFILISGIFTYFEFGEYVTVSKLKFVLNNPEYFKAFFRTYLLNIYGIFFLMIVALLYWIWNPRKTDYSKKALIKNISGLVLSLILYFVVLNQLYFAGKDFRLTPDVSLALAFKHLNHSTPLGLHKSERIELQKHTFNKSINIVLIINESWGKKSFSPDMNNSDKMPLLGSLLNEGDFVYFSNAFSNSSATDVSVPSLLTGVAPYENSKTLHEMPLLWDWLKSAGFRTYFFSSQGYNWGNISEFFDGPGLDVFLPAEKLNIKFDHDAGIDEVKGSLEFCKLIKSNYSKSDKNLFIYNSNALHTPFQAKSKLYTLKNEDNSRFDKASEILDYSMNNIIKAMKDLNIYDNSIIIITGDHGETDSMIHKPLNRLYCFYDEIMNIPFMIKIPGKTVQSEEEAQADKKRLLNNSGKIVSNLDILPTILDYLQLLSFEENEKLSKKMAGYSLFGEIPDNRYVVGLNTNDIRQWEHDGFGIYWKNMRFVYTDLQNAGLYNISEDPNQLNNLWKSAKSEDKLFVNRIIDSIYHLKRIYPSKSK